MEIALYHPEKGYYSSGCAHIGKSGDFYTSVSVGRIFAQILYTQFEEVWNALKQPSCFPLVEFGAHTGLFASDILQYAAELNTPFSKSLEYHIVESHPKLQQVQNGTLSHWPHQIHSCWEDVPPFQGMVFANELLDAFPVHLIEWSGSHWTERHITEDNGMFRFIAAEIADDVLEAATHSIPIPLPPGYVTEVCPLRQSWLKQLSQRFLRGALLFIDYGYPREEYFAPYRTSGTLACYHHHRRTYNPLVLVGKQDITAHVEFTSLIEGAKNCGFSLAGFTDQHHFLTAAAEPWLRSVEQAPLTDSLQSNLRRFQTLLHPALMGSQFHVMALTRELTPPVFSGFRYSRKDINNLRF